MVGSTSSDGTILLGARLNDGNGGKWSCEYINLMVHHGNNVVWISMEKQQMIEGYSVALSSDGTIVAIGATQNGGNGYSSGHTRVYEWNDNYKKWEQRGNDIDGEAGWDNNGYSVSLSSDENSTNNRCTLESWQWF